jgi:hypothetical protein
MRIKLRILLTDTQKSASYLDLQVGWSHRYKNFTVITIWLTVTMFSFLYHCQEFYWNWLSIWVTRRVSCKKQELHTLHEHLISALFFYGICDADFFLVFLCCPIMCLCVLSSVLWCPLWFPHKNNVQFVFTCSCL